MEISEKEYKKMMELASSYDKVKAAQKKYRESHRELVNKRIYDWRERNKEKFNAIQKRCTKRLYRKLDI